MGSRPSVVFLTVDCLRADHMGCYGYDRPTTPAIDAFADEATLYEHSYANSPGTRWALQVIHTGVHTDQIAGLGVPDDVTSLAAAFKQHGYATGGFAKNGFLTRDYGYDAGFDTFCDVADFRSDERLLRRVGERLDETVNSRWFHKTVLKPIQRRLQSAQADAAGGAFRPNVTDEETVGRALSWIAEQRATDTPFFAWIHLMDAHTPYARWDGHLVALRGDTDIEHVIEPHADIAEARENGRETPAAVIDAYDAGIRSADEQVGRVLDALADDAVVAITGDHGEEFGRYNPFHVPSLHSSMTQVPLLVRAAGMDGKRVDGYPVQHLDIAPTLVDAAGGTPPTTWEGASLCTVARATDEPMFFSVDAERGVRVGDWKLIRRASDELYATPHHGDDAEDVAADYPEKRDELAALLDDHEDWLARNRIGAGERALDDGASDLSETTRENLEELGYLEG